MNTKGDDQISRALQFHSLLNQITQGMEPLHKQRSSNEPNILVEPQPTTASL